MIKFMHLFNPTCKSILGDSNVDRMGCSKKWWQKSVGKLLDNCGVTVNLLILDFFPYTATEYCLPISPVYRWFPWSWWVTTLENLQHDVLSSLKQKGFHEAWKPALVRKTWNGHLKEDSIFRRALKKN